jgi:hypothetical protein
VCKNGKRNKRNEENARKVAVEQLRDYSNEIFN